MCDLYTKSLSAVVSARRAGYGKKRTRPFEASSFIHETARADNNRQTDRRPTQPLVRTVGPVHVVAERVQGSHIHGQMDT